MTNSLAVLRPPFTACHIAWQTKLLTHGSRLTDNGGRQYGCRKPRTPKVLSLISHLSLFPLFLDNSAIDVVSFLHYVKIKIESDGSLILRMK